MKKRGHPRFYELLKEIEDLHYRKNSDYGGDEHPLANLKRCEQFGVPAWLGCLVRISDKWSRVVTLASGKEQLVKDEVILDTLKDMSIYALLCIVLYEEINK